MHRCLQIVEILDMICLYLHPSHGAECDLAVVSPDRLPLVTSNLAAVARTCKIFQDPALDHLWKCVPLPILLTRCMPSDLWAVDTTPNAFPRHTMRQLRPIYPSDWDRLRFYAPRVRRLWSPSFEWSLHKVFPVLNLAFPNTVLHNLQSLTWDHTEVDFHYIRIFLRPTLTKITLRFTSESGSSLLASLIETCPKLIDINISSGYFDLGPISHFVLGLQVVEALDVPALDQNALEHLSQLPTLKSLRLESPPNLVVSPMYPGLSFPALHNLCIASGDMTPVVQILRLCTNVPLKLFSFTFFDFYTAAELCALLDAVSGRGICHSSLAELSVGSEEDPLDDLTLHILTPDTICLLFCFPNLTYLSLDTALGFDFDDDMVSKMAHAWPRMETLQISARSPPRSPRTTPACLQVLARHCPLLVKLTMAFDGTTIPAINPGDGEQECLHELSVQHSPITSPSAMARYLSRLFPNLKAKDIWTHWDIFEPDHPDDAELMQPHRCWQEVKSLLPGISAIREEERISSILDDLD
ncbi:hypothetical protein C8R47DRAFT_644146 [Mycena vitilis]|nr:hypothetical protein C8R47DRAFT_644146 [Mycena vitilis]